MRRADHDRALELLAARATEGLDAAEHAELEALLETSPELEDDSFELAAAAVELACLDLSEPLPPTLRGRLLGQAEGFYGRRSSP